ncbi:hypothetical protein ANN_21471 [Periplaneta americana]|uniref:Histone-lysine N-methyltransferase SETMAR n=1 Tax=Periplaneta americana TaxID=6978 RepID=A0ABQ8SGM5_PERAM|nr:hypothetical protein ANN_21471 [Periplaneta americana]
MGVVLTFLQRYHDEGEDFLNKFVTGDENKRRGMLSSGIVLFHDNARPHTAAATKRLLQRFRWEVFDHTPYSPDLVPSDFHLFPRMKRCLGGQYFGTDNELQTSVENWLKSQAAGFYSTRLVCSSAGSHQENVVRAGEEAAGSQHLTLVETQTADPRESPDGCDEMLRTTYRVDKVKRFREAAKGRLEMQAEKMKTTTL